MKKILPLVIICVLAVFSSTAQDAPAQDKPELEKSAEIIRLIEVPLMDINKAESGWETIPPAVISDQSGIDRYSGAGDTQWTGTNDLSASFKLAYDDEYLYLKADVRDNKIVPRSNALPEGDEIEIYLAFPGDEGAQLAWEKNMFQMRIIPFDERGVFLGYEKPAPIPGSHCLTRKTQDGYGVLASIPWKPFLFKPETGKAIPFEFRLLDVDSVGQPVKKSMVWNNFPGKSKPWKTSAGWGRLKFVKNFSKPYLDGERIFAGSFSNDRLPPSGPLKPDQYTLFLADFDKNCDANFAKGNAASRIKGKIGITSGNKGRFGEALKPIEDYQSTCSYESKNNFNTNEGTVEFWFNSRTKSEEVNFPVLFCIRTHPFGGKQTNTFAVGYDQRIQSLYFSFNGAGEETGRLIMPFKFTSAEWIHFAATWKNINSGKADAVIRFYANGKECPDRIENKKIDFNPPPESRFFLGSTSTEVHDKAGNPAFVSIDDLRISGIAREYSVSGNAVKYVAKRAPDGKLIETRYLCCSLPENKKEIDHIVETAAKANYNILLPSLMPGEYKSDLTTLRSGFAELDFDPLTYMTTKAHQNDLEIHPYLGIGAMNAVFWPCVNFDGGIDEGRVNPGNARARDYIVNELLELSENYEIDGLNLDFIRYSFFNYSKDEAELLKKQYGIDIFSFGEDPATSLNPDRLKWFEWRENNIHDIVRRVWEETRKTDPELIITAMVWPSTPPRIAQAWEVWVKNKWIHRIIVMNYTELAGEAAAVTAQTQLRGGCPEMMDQLLQVYKGSYKSGGLSPMTPGELVRQVQAIRDCNTSGLGHYAFANNTADNFLALNKSVFLEKARPAFRLQKKPELQREKKNRAFDVSSIALNGVIVEGAGFSEVKLQQKEITGGICVNDKSPFKVESMDANGNWQFLIESAPGEIGLSSLLTFPPVRTEKLKITPGNKIVAATPFFGADRNTVTLENKKWTIISPPASSQEDLKELPLFKMPSAGQLVMEAEAGLRSGSAAFKKVADRTFADLPSENPERKKLSDKAGDLRYAIEITEEGEYELWALVNGPTPVSDSLFVEMGGIRQTWHVTTKGIFEWRCLCSDFGKNKKYILFHLKPGKYLLKFFWREPGTQFDKICIRPRIENKTEP